MRVPGDGVSSGGERGVRAVAGAEGSGRRIPEGLMGIKQKEIKKQQHRKNNKLKWT